MDFSVFFARDKACRICRSAFSRTVLLGYFICVMRNFCNPYSSSCISLILYRRHADLFSFRQRHLSIHRNGVEVNMQTRIYKQKISRRNAFSSSVTSAQLPHAVIHLLIYSIAGLPAGWCVKVT